LGELWEGEVGEFDLEKSAGSLRAVGMTVLVWPPWGLVEDIVDGNLDCGCIGRAKLKMKLDAYR
jgi:hypothetical protein